MGIFKTIFRVSVIFLAIMLLLFLVLVGVTAYAVFNLFTDKGVPEILADNIDLSPDVIADIQAEWEVNENEWVYCIDDYTDENDILTVKTGHFTEVTNATPESAFYSYCEGTPMNIHPHYKGFAQPSYADVYSFGDEDGVKFMCIMYNKDNLACYNSNGKFDEPVRVTMEE